MSSRSVEREMKWKGKLGCKGVTIVELMCVLAIISILLALYLPTIARAFGNVKRFLLGE